MSLCRGDLAGELGQNQQEAEVGEPLPGLLLFRHGGLGKGKRQPTPGDRVCSGELGRRAEAHRERLGCQVGLTRKRKGGVS